MNLHGRRPPEEGGGGRERELRLALVCYGGVSLAIYMHGITKEIHKLVKASRAFEDNPSHNPFGAGQTEHAYWDCLRALQAADRERTATRVVVDIISGTSAGGINGVFLAKALAHDLPQDALRDLWMEKGDIGELLDAPHAMPRVAKYAWLAGEVATNPLGIDPPLDGDRMAKWLFEALRDMDGEQDARHSLVPPGHSLELHVTATDFYGYLRSTQAGSVVARDRSHRHVFTFRLDPGAGVDHFLPTDSRNAALAFAARATSSFPGAFPPISIESLEAVFAKDGVHVEPFESDLFRLYTLQGDEPRASWFVDGGVLDNYPFGHAIDAIRRKPADREVVRRLVYLQPDPGHAPAPPSGEEPSLIRTVWKTLSSIPRSEPIVDNLLEVRSMNERVRNVREIIETSFEDIRQIVLKEAPASGFTPDASAEAIEQCASSIHSQARSLAGLGYPTYVRLKLQSVLEALGAVVASVCNFPPVSDHAYFVRTLAHEWAAGRRYLAQEPEPTDDQVAFLRAFDVGYRLRRVHFLIAGVNWLYEKGSPSRSELDEAKKRLWAIANRLQGVVSGGSLPEGLKHGIVGLFEPARARNTWTEARWDPPAMLVSYRDAMDQLLDELQPHLEEQLQGIGETLYRDFLQLAGEWPDAIRRDLLVRYIGFPLWDSVLFPVHALGGVTERDRVEVVRMSPDEATRLNPGGAEAKLKGVGFHHFAAFFKREWRENDYVWGRLDGAELLIRVLMGDAGAPHLAAAARAIAKDEETLEGAADALAAVEAAFGLLSDV